MKTRTIILTLALCFVGVAVVFAEDANMGTRKLNEAKSTLPLGRRRIQQLFTRLQLTA